MSKTGILYVGSIAAFVLGLWAILAVGNNLQPPYALGGVWEPVEDAPPGAVPFTISQSGRFLTPKPADGRPLHLTWESETTDPAGARTIRLRGDGQSVEVHATPPAQPDTPPAYRFTLQGTLSGSWVAVRTGEELQNHSQRAH